MFPRSEGHEGHLGFQPEVALAPCARWAVTNERDASTWGSRPLSDPLLARHPEEPVSPSFSLPLLDRVRVATPCDVPWESMQGDDVRRHCQQCDKHVHNLSTLTRAEAEALLRHHTGGGICIRFYRREDGTVLTADCPVGVRRRRRWRAVSALAVGTLASLAGLFACTTSEPPSEVTAEPRSEVASPEATDLTGSQLAPGSRMRAPVQTSTASPLVAPRAPAPSASHPGRGVFVTGDYASDW